MVLSAGTATSKDRPAGNSYFCVEADMLSCRVQQRTKRDVRFRSRRASDRLSKERPHQRTRLKGSDRRQLPSTQCSLPTTAIT